MVSGVRTGQPLIWPLASSPPCRNAEGVAGGRAGGHLGLVLLVHPPGAPSKCVFHAGPSPQPSSVYWLYSLSSSSKSSLAEGRSVAKLESPRCFSILSPCTIVVLTTLLTLRPSTGSA